MIDSALENKMKIKSRLQKKCEHGEIIAQCRFCSIHEDTQGLIRKDLLL